MKINDIEEFRIEKLSTAGFQATNLGIGIEIIKRMKEEKAKIFFGFTANLVASGIRGLIADWVRKKFVDVIVTTGGSLDHDLIKAHKPYLLGSFYENDAELHKKGINRIGNILVPGDRYELLEKKIQPIFEKCYEKYGRIASPSEIAYEIGLTIQDDSSFLKWASKNNIPVFCPGITDSAIGLQTYFFKHKKKDFGIDVTKDMKRLADIVLNAEKTGAVVLGGGISKHHIIGVNLLRGGLDYAVYVTTAQPWDGSLSGARTDEGISWGKIKEKARHVTIDGDATIVFPLLHGGVKIKNP
ncbi:MAG: deoxyhypusine synthase [Candidatus Anstonellales archaeon]